MNSPCRETARARLRLAAWMAACALLAACALPTVATDAQADATSPEGVEPLQRFPTATVRIGSARRAHEFRTWVADTPARLRQGLMFVRVLDADRAMYFPLGPPQWASFWMKNTYVSLDLLFIAADGRIVNIAANATPLSLDPIPAAGPVVAVLEVVAGTAARLAIVPGDRVELIAPAGRQPAAPPRP